MRQGERRLGECCLERRRLEQCGLVFGAWSSAAWSTLPGPPLPGARQPGATRPGATPPGATPLGPTTPTATRRSATTRRATGDAGRRAREPRDRRSDCDPTIDICVSRHRCTPGTPLRSPPAVVRGRSTLNRRAGPGRGPLRVPNPFAHAELIVRTGDALDDRSLRYFMHGSAARSRADVITRERRSRRLAARRILSIAGAPRRAREPARPAARRADLSRPPRASSRSPRPAISTSTRRHPARLGDLRRPRGCGDRRAGVPGQVAAEHACTTRRSSSSSRRRCSFRRS